MKAMMYRGGAYGVVIIKTRTNYINALSVISHYKIVPDFVACAL